MLILLLDAENPCKVLLDFSNVALFSPFLVRAHRGNCEKARWRVGLYGDEVAVESATFLGGR
jgi:hypothetical protein